MMRRLIPILALLAALVGAGQAQAATMFACAGTPTDTAYRSAFDGVNGQVLDGNVRYPVKTSLWEHQSWLTPIGTEPGHASEHMHVKACLPQGETITTEGQFPSFDVAVTAHNIAGYRATALTGSYVTQTGSSLAFSATQAQLDQITEAMHTSGHLGANAVYLHMPAAPIKSNGLKELRWGFTVVRDAPSALVEVWRIDARNYVTHAIPGLPATVPINDHVRYIRNRTIVDWIKADGTTGSDYHHAGLCNRNLTADGLDGCDSDAWNTADYTSVRPRPWMMGTRVTDGGGDATFELDPNHHVHPDNRGSWFLDWLQRSTSNDDPDQFMTHDVPLGTRTGWHKLFFGSDDLPECAINGNPCPMPGTRPGWRDVVVMPFRAS